MTAYIKFREFIRKYARVKSKHRKTALMATRQG